VNEKSWLDTETKALLQGGGPNAGTGVAAGEYSLVLLRAGEEMGRLVRAAMRVLHCAEPEAVGTLRRRLPLIIASGLSFDDALLGQFEFICCDATTVFLRDEVAHQGRRSYLEQLYDRLRQSEEFAPVTVMVRRVPEGDEGPRYLDQFLGMRAPLLPLRVSVPRKKARIMMHWGNRIGAAVGVVKTRS